MKDQNWKNNSVKQTLKDIPDATIFGDGDAFKLISKIYSVSEGWVEITKALQVDGLGCVLQVQTQQRNQSPPNDNYVISDSLQWIPGVRIKEFKDENSRIVNRKLVAIGQ